MIAGVTPGTEVVLLDPMQDGVEQISQILLSKNSDIKSVHIVSHGAAGSLPLGASYLGLDNLNNYAGELQNWASALTPDADILLYGCEVADGQTGLNFVQQLSQLTGADVAASDDLTGSAALNGDWDLEVKTGSIEAPLVFQFGAMQTYNSVLASVNFLGQTTFPSSTTVGGTTVGGLSGITYDAVNNQFYAISDAKSSPGDPRFYTLNIDLSSGSLGAVNFTGVTQLKDTGGTPYSAGISDTEGIALTNNGSVYISSEGILDSGVPPYVNPFVREFSLSSGNQINNLTIPNKFIPEGNLSDPAPPFGPPTPVTPTKGVRKNLAFESLSFTPDKQFLFTTTEVALAQDFSTFNVGLGNSSNRILRFDKSGNSYTPSSEFLYKPETQRALTDLLAIDSNTLIAIERGNSSEPHTIKLFEVSLAGATDVQGTEALNNSTSGKTLATKTLIADLSTISGLSPLGNFEGLTFGPTLPNGKLSLILIGDNNFSNNTRIAAFEFTPTNPSFTVTNTNDTGIGSLRQAIFNANATSGTDTIKFDIPTTDAGYNFATGAFTIKPKSALPNITDAVVIDGTTQTGFANKPIIELDGSSAGANVNGLTINAGNSTVKGLVINRFQRFGIQLNGNGNNVIEGNYIGTDVNGTQDFGNLLQGVNIFNSSSNRIGGTTAAQRNIISGNDQYGVVIQGSGTGNLVQGNYIGTDVNGTGDFGNSFHGVYINGSASNTIGGISSGAGNVISGNDQHGVYIADSGATGNLVQGNYIGTDAAGTADWGNTSHGVFINNASGNTIGGSSASARNIISNNDGTGVFIQGSGTGNSVQGNYIGTDVNGTADRGNTSYGLYINGSANNTIGGISSGEGNVISGNDNYGVYITGSSATGNKLQGNYIGTNAAGTSSLGNSLSGVRIDGAPSNTIGGASSGARNVISGNKQYGVVIQNSSANFLQGNFIGTQADGTSPLGNNFHGVLVVNTASNNIIGGTNAGEGNTIASNGGDGVYVELGTGNRILSNSIFSNTGLGIDLGTDGVTPNDVGDGDTGANNLQNFPVLTQATTNGSNTTVAGTFNSTASTTFTLQFFSNPASDANEGRTLLATTDVTTDGSGNASFSLNTLPVVAVGNYITATATDPNGNTSEFAQGVVVTPPTGIVEFTAAAYSQLEGNSGNVDKVIAKVKRTGGSAGAVSVQVLLSPTPGTATSPDDYINQLPVIVTFNDGEIGEKDVIIPIVGDTTVESAETINLQLGNTTGGAGLGTQQSATFTIENDDLAANTPPALDLNGSDSGTGYSATFTRGKGAVAIADSSKLTVTDADSTKLSNPINSPSSFISIAPSGLMA